MKKKCIHCYHELRTACNIFVSRILYFNFSEIQNNIMRNKTSFEWCTTETLVQNRKQNWAIHSGLIYDLRHISLESEANKPAGSAN